VIECFRGVGNLEANDVGEADLHLQKTLEQETDALRIVHAIDFGDEVQGFLFNRPHVSDIPLRTGRRFAHNETEQVIWHNRWMLR
jgi:hypothetical protein